MIFDPSNAAGSVVYEVKDGVHTELAVVVCVDMYQREVVRDEMPLRIVGEYFAQHATSYDFISVYPKAGAYEFRCYGKRQVRQH